MTKHDNVESFVNDFLDTLGTDRDPYIIFKKHGLTSADYPVVGEQIKEKLTKQLILAKKDGLT